MKQSAGLLLFRKRNNEVEFFLVHPGGPFFAKKSAGFWTIPKGELLADENPLDAAVREFKEEIGLQMDGEFLALHPIVQKGGKKVLCWAVEGDFDPVKIISNTFDIEWPPKSGKMKSYPEIDQAVWVNYSGAKQLINERQSSFLDQLILILKDRKL